MKRIKLFIITHYCFCLLTFSLFKVVPLKLYRCAKRHKVQMTPVRTDNLSEKTLEFKYRLCKDRPRGKSEGYTIFTLNSVLLQDGSVIGRF